MQEIIISYTEIALKFRETINIVIAVAALVLFGLLVWFVVREVRKWGWKFIEWEVKLSVWLGLWFLGELIRSATVWEILHYQGVKGNYLTDVTPLLVSLTLIAVGSLGAIRILTPARYGNSIWIATLAVAAILVGLNFWLF